MAGRFYLIAFFLSACAVHAQFIVPAGVNMGASGTKITINSTGNVTLGDNNVKMLNANISIALLGTGSLTNSNTARIGVGIDSLRIEGGNYSLLGTWRVKEQLSLKSGKLTINALSSPAGRLIYTGDASGVSANDNSYILGAMLTFGSHSNRFYPIGTATGYYPALLSSVTDPLALLRMQVFENTPPITIGELTTPFPDIDDLVTNRYYLFDVDTAASFAGAPIALSLNNTLPTIDPNKNRPVVVEKDIQGNINDLQGTTLQVSPTSSFVQSESNTTAKGGKYMIAASKEIIINIHKLITPNGDGWNDGLKIDGIDAYYPNNKVTLLDRWGGVYLVKEGFKNDQTDIDYTKLVNGNYICVVEYTDSKGTHKPKPQMITVLK